MFVDLVSRPLHKGGRLKEGFREFFFFFFRWKLAITISVSYNYIPETRLIFLLADEGAGFAELYLPPAPDLLGERWGG